MTTYDEWPSEPQRPRRSDRHAGRGRRRAASGRSTTARPIVEPAPRLRIQKEQRKRALRRALVVGAVALVALVAVGAVAGLLWFKAINRRVSEAALSDTKLAQALSGADAKPTEPFTVLLTGDDRRPGETVARADTIILAKIDPKAKKVWLLSIPRDTRVRIPGYGTSKINAAMSHGGSALLVETVEEFTGIPIDHYMNIDFQGFMKAVDALGGVWIDVDVPINDPKADFSPRNRAAKIDPGYQRLDGEHALTYVRSRAFPDGDFTRMRHQQEFFKALAKQVAEPGNIFKLPTVINEISHYMTSTMSVSEMIRVARAIQGIKPDDVETATITGTWRSPYVWPDEERKAFLIEAMKVGRSFDETSPVEAVVPSTVTVTVRNGAGISGVAAAAADILKRAGFNVTEVGNANQFVYDRTLVVYRDAETKAKASAVAAALPRADLVPSRGMYAFSTDVLVVVGKDWGSVPTTRTP